MSYAPRLPGMRLTHHPMLVLLTVCLIAACAAVVGAYTWLEPGAKADPTTGVAPPAIAEKEQVEAELVTLTPRGFEPSEIKRPHGRFLLAVNNRSGLEEVVLRLDREAGHRLREVRHAKEKRAGWREMVNLPPGQYVLTEANHPEWACRIIITAR